MGQCVVVLDRVPDTGGHGPRKEGEVALRCVPRACESDQSAAGSCGRLRY